MPLTDIRPSPIAGTWYSPDPEQLRQEINAYIDEAAIPEIEGEVVAIVAPHAGYRYSGTTAGYAFRSVQGNDYDLVAVVSPYHQFHTKPLLTSAHQAYETPLGAVPVNQESLKALNQHLEKNAGERLTSISYDGEHSLEIELPFLQCALKGEFELLPVMLTGDNFTLAQEVGRGLADVLRSRKSLLVASTDLSHFYAENVANQLDEEMLKLITALSVDKMIEAKRSGKGEACGLMAVVAVTVAAQELGAAKAHLLHYSTSGQTSGDYQRVVGYGAVVFLK